MTLYVNGLKLKLDHFTNAKLNAQKPMLLATSADGYGYFGIRKLPRDGGNLGSPARRAQNGGHLTFSFSPLRGLVAGFAHRGTIQKSPKSVKPISQEILLGPQTG